MTMTPHNKLRVANLLILAGLVPLSISMVWMVSSFSAAANSKVYVAEALMKIGFAYMVAFVTSCGGIVWSVQVGKRSAGVRVGGTTAIRVLVALLLVAPLLVGIL